LILIEVIAQSVEDAIEAEAGGADRLELVRDLDQDGLTPPAELVRAVRSAVSISVFVMVRPRNRFVLDPGELKVLAAEARDAIAAGANGLVCGYINEEGGLNTDALEVVASIAGSEVGFTFHRAFDRLVDPWAALPVLASCGVQRILSSGGAATAPEGQARLRKLVPDADAHGLAVMAGGGVTPENVVSLVAETGVREVHFGAGAHVSPSRSAPVSRDRVAAARSALLAVERYRDEAGT
jgi:copper homeostasis protein